MSDELHFDDVYRCGYCHGRIYVAGHTTHYYCCSACGLAPIAFIQANTEEKTLTITLSGSEVALLYSAALRERNSYEWHSPIIKSKYERIISALSDAISYMEPNR